MNKYDKTEVYELKLLITWVVQFTKISLGTGSDMIVSINIYKSGCSFYTIAATEMKL